MLGKVNEVKVDFAGYRYYIRGQYKIGKTSLFYYILKNFYKDLRSGLLLSIGREDGYKTLQGIVYERITEWYVDKDDYPEYNEVEGRYYRWEEDDNGNKFKYYMPVGFVNVVNELVFNREKYKHIKLIGLDVVDELIRIVEPIVIAMWNKTRSPNERVRTINEAFGGYGRGQNKVQDLIDEQMIRLADCGYGIFQISHSKHKTIKEKGTNEEYTVLGAGLDARYDGIFAKKADIVATLAYDRTVQTVTNKGKDGKIIDVTSSKRWIHFRDDGFNVDCGSRFTSIIPKTEYSPDNFIEAVIDAIKKDAGKTNDEKIVEEMKKEEENRIEKGLQYAKQDKVNSKKINKQELIDEFKELFMNETDEEKKKKIVELVSQIPEEKRADKNKPTINDFSVEELQKAIGILKGE